MALWVLPVHGVHRAEGWRGGRGLVKHQHSSRVTSYRLAPPNTRVNNQRINKRLQERKRLLCSALTAPRVQTGSDTFTRTDGRLTSCPRPPQFWIPPQGRRRSCHGNAGVPEDAPPLWTPPTPQGLTPPPRSVRGNCSHGNAADSPSQRGD